MTRSQRRPAPRAALPPGHHPLSTAPPRRAGDPPAVPAVKAPADDGDQPSRFLAELGVEPRDVTGRPRRPLSVAALVA
ncbi:hypothetical protein, partial [Streptomyces galbus]